jgi:hypothetical protein
MCELSPLQAKSVNDVSTDLVKETVTPETKYKLETKKKHNVINLFHPPAYSGLNCAGSAARTVSTPLSRTNARP